MGGLPLAFGAPLVLGALVLLPAIWWLLKLTPPRPRIETFPPTRILAEIVPKEEQPARSPWWLTALRLLLAALVIFALAAPVWRPVGESAPGDGPLLLVLDNDWAAARDWPARIDTAKRVAALAEGSGRPVTLVATAEPPNQEFAPTDARSVAARLDALQPRPFDANRAAIASAMAPGLSTRPFGGVVWLTSGLGSSDAEGFARFLNDSVKAPASVYAGDGKTLLGLTPPTIGTDALTLPITRSDGRLAGAGLVEARDLKGRSVGTAPFAFKAGETKADAVFNLPAELRNEIVRVEIAGSATVGAVQLLDDRFKRRRIGIVSGGSSDNAQPLLSPRYYIARAVQPFADVIEPRDANAATAIPQLIDAGAAIIVLADIGTLTPDVEQRLSKWVEDGGTLLRFAGPRLAAATADENTLVPVRLREGGRVLGGSLSWSSPQPLASFSENGPFAGMAVPTDVTVVRQVLAEPDANLAARTWAALGDGTPLVTAGRLGKGWLVLFHVTADTSWSNLPLSGSFVDMLRRIAAFSTVPLAAADAKPVEGTAGGVMLPPWRLLDGFGRSAQSDPFARPLAATAENVTPNRDHPPGLYGTDDAFRAVNLLRTDATLPAFDASLVNGASVQPYPTTAPTDLSPFLLLAAFACLIADALAVLWLNGGLRLRRAVPAAVILLALLGGALPRPAHADAAADQFAMDAVNATRLAYVVTGNAAIDEVSKAGLAGLSHELANRTALEPSDPIGVDVAKDELAFFPLLYWPIDASAPMPTSETLARIDAYMKQGGSILFDTRDELSRPPGTEGFGGTPEAERLRAMLAGLDIPPLEPVPGNHVLTKAFYLLADFPGRYSGGPLWVEASAADEDPAAAGDRPVRPGDGVSSILITENDLAGAWATDPDGRYLYPTVPPDPRQREMAYRTGINIVMYTLTGNYKADQVHVPALLERLGQ
ncbi:N-terminal double-transmembrane domain-containing protein [Kaistia soli DSM 19436]|uniref:N-terminal double-transmembrane domain-containing protein n=1 Tax=Kaistia soli DSM 19436 TaxID=1122133 RepID=A0A1M4Z7L5_9HYPH|nr:DUF4159 domain-containing protein [Kaistia soli]SHF14014.1 N-terminal double-transmembrane domain-containing protein [Kaistia soli DSM 19436]